MMIVFVITIIYSIGFLSTLTFFKYFGEKLGFDYNGFANSTDWYDDWESNEQAFITFSLVWPFTILVLLVMCIGKLLFKFGKWFLNK